MRPRTELALAAGVAAALVIVAFATGRAGRAGDDPDPRASSFLAGREGVRGLADAAERLGIRVSRWRRRPQEYVGSMTRDSASAFVVIDPARPISTAERNTIAVLVSGLPGDGLVLAGARAEEVMHCFGYVVWQGVFDSAQVVRPGTTAAGQEAWTHAHLDPIDRDSSDASAASDSSASIDAGASTDSTASTAPGDSIASSDSSNPVEARTAARGAERERHAAPRDVGDESEEACPDVTVTATDTLLVTTEGEPAMLRLTVAPHGNAVLLVGDAALLRNRTLRRSTTGPFVLREVVRGHRGLVFDEHHQGFGAGGSMARVALAWSARHPAGWFVWQLAAVGLLALLVSGVRLGPVRAFIPRQRRSALEHVRALATALASSGGHLEAVAAMVRGLMRRLGLPHTSGRDAWRTWLDGLARRAPNPRVRQHAEHLQRLAHSPRHPTAVLRAAHAVEDLWRSLRP